MEGIEVKLIGVKDFIVSRVTTELVNTGESENDLWVFTTKLNEFLQRLIDIKDGEAVKKNFQLKAGRQLLCSIGIDIKHNIVPVNWYCKIFKNIDFENPTKHARQLYWDCIRTHNFYYRDSEKDDTVDYSVLVCPIKDWKYYFKPPGVFGHSQNKYVHNWLMDSVNNGEITTLFNPKLSKGEEFLYFWTTVESEITQFFNSSQRAVCDIVDQLGLSHFDFEREGMQYFFYIKLEGATIETFKPNATMVDWSCDKTGFLSHSSNGHGRTFSISGYVNYDKGLKERVFHRVTLGADSLKQTRIIAIPGDIHPPPVIKADDIVNEGLSRFND